MKFGWNSTKADGLDESNIYYNSISIVTRYTLSLYHIQSITHTVIIIKEMAAVELAEIIKWIGLNVFNPNSI